VTGANRGVGAAIVQEMLKAGVAKIFATSRNPKTLPAFGDPRVVPLQLDITSDASVNAAAAAFPSAWGRCCRKRAFRGCLIWLR